ncbi:MAG: hypothetical protein R2695_15305 [Acidimicrobiales bacterium]
MLSVSCGADGAPPPATSGPSVVVDTTVPATVAAPSTEAPEPPLTSVSLPVTRERPADLPRHNVYRPSDLSSLDRPMPVIVWGNGGCVRHDGTWRPMLERWAAAGFLVITVAAAEPPVEGEPGAMEPHTAADQAAGIDWAIAADTRSGDPLEGRVDVSRIVAAGNSCGGITALGIASTDDRVDAVFVLSGSSVFPGASAAQAAEVMGEVTAPVAYVVGGPEDLASSMATQDVEQLPPGVGGLVVARHGGDHVLVSTDPTILADVAEIALNWMDLTLYGNETAAATLVDGPCARCDPDEWTITTHELDMASGVGFDE